MSDYKAPSGYKVKRFRLKRDSKINPEVKAGSYVFELLRHDYSLASDDTRATGIEHVSVTLSPEGDYPSFTIPVRDLEEVIE